MKKKRLSTQERKKLMQELFNRYGAEDLGRRQRLLYLRKKYIWLFCIRSAYLLKRFIDITASLAGLVFLSPLFMLIALLIKATDRGPVLYISNRVGQFGKEFRFPKFRSMRVNADKEQKVLQKQSQHKEEKTFKIKNDPRVTWIGRIIRKFSLDELPQLFCVLIGEMSLVGPRPPLPSEVALYSVQDRKRLDTKPGLTCIWQVSGRSDIAFDQQLQLDLQYIESQNFLLDIKLILKTIPAVIFGRGAY